MKSSGDPQSKDAQASQQAKKDESKKIDSDFDALSKNVKFHRPIDLKAYDKFKKLKESDLPVDEKYWDEVQAKLEQVWKVTSIKNQNNFEAIKESLFKDHEKLTQLVAEALTIRLGYNAKKANSLNKGAIPFTSKASTIATFPEFKLEKPDGNLDFIQEIENKTLACLLDSNKTSAEVYNDLLDTLKDVSVRAQARFTLAGGSGIMGAYRMFRARWWDKSDLTTVIDSMIKENKFEKIKIQTDPVVNAKTSTEAPQKKH